MNEAQTASSAHLPRACLGMTLITLVAAVILLMDLSTLGVSQNTSRHVLTGNETTNRPPESVLILTEGIDFLPEKGRVIDIRNITATPSNPGGGKSLHGEGSGTSGVNSPTPNITATQSNPGGGGEGSGASSVNFLTPNITATSSNPGGGGKGSAASGVNFPRATQEPSFYRCTIPNPELFAQGSTREALSFPKAPAESDSLPMVTITTAHRGERHLERNIWLNVRYQSYPPSRLELVIVESSDQPSKYLTLLSERKEPPFVRYHHAPPPRIRNKDMWVGNARNLMNEMANGTHIVSMDNDDIYPPNYVLFMIHHLTTNLAGKDEPPILVVQLKNRKLTVLPTSTFSITALQGSAMIGGHHIAYEKSSKCRFLPLSSSEEQGWFKCAKRMSRLKRVDPLPSTAMIKVDNPISITNQLFYMNRAIFTLLNPADWINFLHGTFLIYENIHSSLRPSCISPDPMYPTLPPHHISSSVYQLEKVVSLIDFSRENISTEEALARAEARPVGSSSGSSLEKQGLLADKGSIWNDVVKSKHAPCSNFSRIPGQKLKEELITRSIHVAKMNGSEADIGEKLCCEACSGHKRCSVYQYEVYTGNCVMADRTVDPPYKGKSRADLWGLRLTYLVSGALLSTVTGVRDEDCGRCARKIKL
ncbi:hypothetical protein AAMO2058_001690800 [Amorphochlora amoebiformis]